MMSLNIPYDGIITLLIFLVGIPAIVLQFMAPEVRFVVFEKRKIVPLEVIRALIISLIAVLSGIILAARWVAFQNLIWIVMFGILLADIIWVTRQVQYHYGFRENVINLLRDRAIQEMETGGGRLIGEAISNLVEIGRQSEPGSDRQVVLLALKDVVLETCRQPDYRGETFEQVIEGVTGMLATQPTAKDLLNYTTAVEILTTILITDPANGGNHSLRDQQLSVQALSALGRTILSKIDYSLGIEALQLKYEETFNLALLRHPVLRTDVSQALLETGMAALASGHYLFAVSAMERLLNVAEGDPLVPAEALYDLLGLAAHFWAADGSSREYINRRMDRLKACAKPWPDILHKAQDHCLKTMNFDTADKISKLHLAQSS